MGTDAEVPGFIGHMRVPIWPIKRVGVIWPEVGGKLLLILKFIIILMNIRENFNLLISYKLYQLIGRCMRYMYLAI